MVKFTTQLVSVFLLALVLVSNKGFAQDVNTSDPYKLVMDLGTQLFKAVGAAKEQQANSPEQMAVLVDSMLMPYIDVPFASYKILGSQLKKTTKEQRKGFVNAMQRDLTKTYSTALAQYNDQIVNYAPARSVGNKRVVAVKTVLVSPGAPDVDMIFKLRKNKKTGQWKAYDLVVEGISLIDAKRAELAKPLRDKGIVHVTGLISQ